jgi:hypothetical protein
MALALKLTKGAVDAGYTFFYVEDTTGVYSGTNTGGWDPTGVNNPARSSYALFVYGYRYIKDSDDTAIVINNTADPLTVTQWEIPMEDDGYRYFTMLGIPELDYVYGDTGVTAANGIYYYQGAYWKALGALTTYPLADPNNWEAVTDLTTTAVLDTPSVESVTLDLVTNYFGKQCMQTQMFQESKDNCDCDKNNRAEVRPYQKVFSMLYVAGILCAQAKYMQADDELKALSEYCSTLDCSTC